MVSLASLKDMNLCLVFFTTGADKYCCEFVLSVHVRVTSVMSYCTPKEVGIFSYCLGAVMLAGTLELTKHMSGKRVSTSSINKLDGLLKGVISSPVATAVFCCGCAVRFCLSIGVWDEYTCSTT